MNGLHIYGIYSIPDGERRWAYPDVLQEQAGVDKNRAFDQIGMDDAIKNFKAKNPDWNSGSDRAIAEKLVNVEIKDPEASNYVGAPTTTVTVTKDGIKWANKGACK
jgi:hypothetical protein